MDKAKFWVRPSTRWGVVWCDEGETVNQESGEGPGRGPSTPPRDHQWKLGPASEARSNLGFES